MNNSLSKETIQKIKKRQKEFRKAEREGRVVYDNINLRVYIKEKKDEEERT